MIDTRVQLHAGLTKSWAQRTLFCACFLMANTALAVSERQSDTSVFGHVSAPLLLSQFDVAGEAAVRVEPDKQVVVQTFSSDTAAQNYLMSLSFSERERLEVVASEKKMLQVYLGPYDTNEEARAFAKKIDTNVLRYRISYIDSLQGYVVNFGLFEEDENLQNLYRVLASFGVEEVSSIANQQTVYQVVRKRKSEKRPSPTDPNVVEGLDFDELFFDGVPSLDAQDGEISPGDKSWFSELEWNGYIKNETAYRYREPRSITKIRNILYLTTRHTFRDDVDFFFAGRYYYDAAYDLFNYDTITARSERDAEEPLVFVERLDEEKDSNIAEIRELYADIFFEGADLRIGKQFIIWGVLEGVRIVDEINPIDFRELILPDLLDYRIPLWSLKLDYFGENTDYQFVWIPDLRFHKPAPRGSEWEMLQNVCVGQEPEILCVINEPESWSIRDSEVGFKISKVLWDTEMTFSYFYTWDDFPVIFRAVRVDVTQVPPAFFPTYTRIQMYGATAVKQVDKYILKGEFTYVTGKYFGIKNTADEDENGYVDSDGVFQREHIRWGFGIEFNFLGFDIAPGITQWVIFEHEKSMMQPKYDTTYNVFLRKELPGQGAVFQMLAIYLDSLDEILLKPKVTVQLDDQLQLGVGLDLFYGLKSDFGSNAAARSTTGVFDPGFARAQFVGNFNDNDRVYFELKYSF